MLPVPYRAQFRNGMMLEFLAEKRSVEILDAIIEKESRLYSELRAKKLDGVFAPSPHLSIQQARKLFPDVKTIVDGIVGVRVADNPQIDYPSLKLDAPDALAFYLCSAISLGIGAWAVWDSPAIQEVLGMVPFMGVALLSYGWGRDIHRDPDRNDSEYQTKPRYRIRLGGRRRDDAIVHLAHEYGHYLLDLTYAFPLDGYRIYEEGFCRGMERPVCDEYATQAGDEGSLYEHLDMSLTELIIARNWLRSRLGYKERKIEVSITPSSLDEDSKSFKLMGEFDEYVFGTAAFSIIEAEHGRGVYKDILDGRFALPQ